MSNILKVDVQYIFPDFGELCCEKKSKKERESFQSAESKISQGFSCYRPCQIEFPLLSNLHRLNEQLQLKRTNIASGEGERGRGGEREP